MINYVINEPYIIFRDTSALPADYFKSSPKAKIEMDMRGKSDEFNQEMSKEIGDPDTLIKTKVRHWSSTYSLFDLFF